MSLPYWDFPGVGNGEGTIRKAGKSNRKTPSHKSGLSTNHSRSPPKPRYSKPSPSLLSMRSETRKLELELEELEKQSALRRQNRAYITH